MLRQFGGEAAVGVIVASVLAVMIVPLPPMVLDLLLAISITSSLLVLLIALSVKRPLDFSVFPTLLLVMTLYRLGLNVASTRLILLHGSTGTHAAGGIIGAFGTFVVGGNLVVGFVVFVVLVVINFVVITKGAGRIAEVAARFVLDALPGKQMSVDAELAAGSLTDEQARARRRSIEQEADFYGAMDGASKFVRGDAIAGLIITGINIVGGLVIGVVQHNMSAAEAAQRFTILTVGEGLVAQVPALLISTAAGAVVTRAATGDSLAPMLGAQLFGDPARLRLAAGAAILLGMVPGMPLGMFGVVAGTLWLLSNSSAKLAAAVQEPIEAPKPAESERPLEEVLDVDRLRLEVGYALVPLVDAERGGEILRRLQAIRRQIATDLGVIIPAVHVRDDLTLAPGGYRILISGAAVAQGELRLSESLAMSAGDDKLLERIPGTPTVEPAFGLNARWIAKESVLQAERLGLAVVDAATVLATHFSEVVRANAADLLGRQDVYGLIERVQKESPKLVEDLIPGLMSSADVHYVLRDLLAEGVSIRDMRTVLEALAEVAPRTQAMHERVEAVRRRLARQLSAPFVGKDNIIWAAFLDRGVEQRLRDSLLVIDGEPALAPDMAFAKHVLASVEQLVRSFEGRDRLPLLVVAADLRRPLRDFVKRFVTGVTVLTHRELPARAELRAIGTVGGVEASPTTNPAAPRRGLAAAAEVA